MNRMIPVLCIASIPAFAIDPGWASALGDGLRVEVRVEQYRRDIEQEMRNSPFTFVGEQKEERIWLRLAGPAGGGKWEWSVQGGAVKSDDSENTAPGVGGGLERVLMGGEHARITLFGGVEYVHGIEYRDEGGRFGSFIVADDSRRESHVEWGGGLRWLWDVSLSSGWAMQAYTGPLLTAIHGSGEEHFAFPDGTPVKSSLVGGDSSVNFSEDGVFGVVAGLGFRHATGPALRIEARLVDRTILGAGFAWAF